MPALENKKKGGVLVFDIALLEVDRAREERVPHPPTDKEAYAAMAQTAGLPDPKIRRPKKERWIRRWWNKRKKL